jgi:rhamnogalacturonyl hydrolase YesR
MTRYLEAAGIIQAWGDLDDPSQRGRTIIDSLMNMPLLRWATQVTGENRFAEAADRHVAALRDHIVRPDASTFHTFWWDPVTGEPLRGGTAQGHADDSCWARGQAWALYGYTMLYRETRNPLYLKQAHASARFIRTHPRLPSDKIPLWDFDAPSAPEPPRDASAAAVIASALIELADYSEPDTAQRYRELAWRQLVSLSSPGYRAAPGENGGFILKHSTGNFNKNSEVDTPLNYADYYFLETLLRLKARAQDAQSSPAV